MTGRAAGSADPWMRFLAALETGCGTCGGTGKTVREQWRTWYRQADELVRVAQAARRATDLTPDRAAQDVPSGPAGPHLPDPAPEPSIVAAIDRAIDDHMRARPQDPEEEPCEACDGSGLLLTAAGRHLADLLARHGFVRTKRGG